MTTYYRVEISVSDLNDQVFEASLLGERWFIRLLWNEYGQYWTMSLNDYKNNALVYNMKIVANYPIGAEYATDERLPDGEFIVESERDEKVLRDDFKDGIAHLYFDYSTES